VCGEVTWEGERVNGGGEGEGIWLTCFIYISEIEQSNLLQLFKWDGKELQ
jgi:hypothetical protein